MATLRPKHVMSEFGFPLCKANFDELRQAEATQFVKPEWHSGTMNEKSKHFKKFIEGEYVF